MHSAYEAGARALELGAERYLHRNGPVLTSEVTSRFGSLASGVGYFLWAVIALYGYLRLRNLGASSPTTARPGRSK